ncbi:alpha/beta hydrolase [Variovorax sp. YR752]|uniref:alpha/beta fold hydrolase n=1 Tax=Variovorax sp. YR752 TaxID=1884383 RepID=UPI0031377668
MPTLQGSYFLLHAWSIDVPRPSLSTARPHWANPLHFQRRDLLRAVLFGSAAGLAACGGGGDNVGTAPAPVHNDQPVTSTDRRVKVSTAPEVSLQVRDWQRPGGPDTSAPVIVLLAGLGGNARCFDSLAPALVAAGAASRVVAVSRRGYGLSDKPLPVKSATQHYEVDALVDDLAALCNALGLTRVVLGGHSIAGNELTRFASRFPDHLRGLVYLDTTFDYTKNADTGGEDPPMNRQLDEPAPTPDDGRSMKAAVAYLRRKSKNWWPALEANLHDALDELADGSVRPNTPDAVETAMDTAAHRFSPDYRPVRAPALVVTALPLDQRDLFPWLERPLDAQTGKDAADFLRIFRRVRRADADRLVAALDTPHRLTLDHCNHTDFFMEREAEVVRAIQSMRWA